MRFLLKILNTKPIGFFGFLLLILMLVLLKDIGLYDIRSYTEKKITKRK